MVGKSFARSKKGLTFFSKEPYNCPLKEKVSIDAPCSRAESCAHFPQRERLLGHWRRKK